MGVLPYSKRTAQLIAVASQNRRTVTGHVGRCRRFKLFDPHTGAEVSEIELPLDAVLHEVDPSPGHPLAQAGALITSGAGPGLQQRLARYGIDVHLTANEVPAEAVRAGVPSAVMPAESCGHGHAGHHHHHDDHGDA
jgi:predicted Fe-Mo cluster-binding NifX family protein